MLSTYVSPAARRARQDEDGLSLVEIVIAGFVLAVAVLGLASVASASLVSVRDSRERDRATAAASAALEAARALTYDEVALRENAAWTTDPLVQASGTVHLLDHDGDGTFTEQIWASTAGAITPYTCTSESTSCWFDMPAGTRVEVRTFVTWYPDAAQQQAKRVTAVATWEDPSLSAPRVVRMSTLIAPAGRGLPAPAFEILPKELGTTIDQIAINNGYEECFQHTLTNYGSEDGYDIELDPGEGWVPYEPVTEGTWRNGHWIFRAYFIPPGETVGSGTLMRADVGGVTFNVGSHTTLDTGESAEVHFCYRPRGIGAEGGTTPTPSTSPHVYEPNVRSKFDPNVDDGVRHTITVVYEGLRLFLHYDWNSVVGGVHTRPVRARVEAGASLSLTDGTLLSTGVNLFDQFSMNRTMPPSGSLPDYDVHIRYLDEQIELPGRLNRRGLLLPRVPLTISGLLHPAEVFAAEWDFQFDTATAPVTFTNPTNVNLWGALQGDPPPGSRYCVRAQLVKFEMLPNGTFADPVVVAETTRRFRPVAGQFSRLGAHSDDADFSLAWTGGTQSLMPGDVLRLRAWNNATLLDLACVTFHIGFGVDTGSGASGGYPNEFVATLDLWP